MLHSVQMQPAQVVLKVHVVSSKMFSCQPQAALLAGCHAQLKPSIQQGKRCSPCRCSQHERLAGQQGPLNFEKMHNQHEAHLTACLMPLWVCPPVQGERSSRAPVQRLSAPSNLHDGWHARIQSAAWHPPCRRVSCAGLPQSQASCLSSHPGPPALSLEAAGLQPGRCLALPEALGHPALLTAPPEGGRQPVMQNE